MRTFLGCGKTLIVNADAILALAGGVALTTLLLLDAVGLVRLGADGYAKGAVPVLSAIGFSLLHERRARQKVVRQLGTALTSVGAQLTAMETSLSDVEKTVAASIDHLATDFPFHVLEHTAHWDLRSPENAIATRLMKVRFNRREVIITQRAKSDGVLLGTSIKVGPPDGYRAPLKRIELPFLDADGETEWIVPLDRPWYRREVMMIESERTLKDSFTNPTAEWVQIKIVYPTDRCWLHVVWPPDQPPTHLRINRVACGASAHTTIIPLSLLQGAGDRKVLKTYEIENPELGDLITLSWQWGLGEHQTQPPASIQAAATS